MAGSWQPTPSRLHLAYFPSCRAGKFSKSAWRQPRASFGFRLAGKNTLRRRTTRGVGDEPAERRLNRDGRQPVVAPMPGKVVRVLVAAGEAIEAGQGIAVVEAMKMQNEVRSPKSGSVERLFVAEGQTVNAGEVLATIV